MICKEKLVNKIQNTKNSLLRDELLTQLISMDSNLIYKIARKYTKYGIDLDDLYQDGVIGYIEAIKRFDKSKNCKFSTYVFYYIQGHIERKTNTYHTICKPRQTLINGKYKRNYASEDVGSLDRKIPGYNTTLSDFISDGNTVKRFIYNGELKNGLKNLISKISGSKSGKIIEKHYGLFGKIKEKLTKEETKILKTTMYKLKQNKKSFEYPRYCLENMKYIIET